MPNRYHTEVVVLSMVVTDTEAGSLVVTSREAYPNMASGATVKRTET